MSLADATRRTAGRDGAIVTIDGEAWMCISGFDRMPPFLMSLPSACDLWMYISSGGGLTAGRVSPDGAVFPYVTVDQLHDAHHHTGPLTLLRVRRGGAASVLWEPFAMPGEAPKGVERNLYKSAIGDRLVFEEVHRGLGLAFRYRWGASATWGYVRTATLENIGGTDVTVDVLDGVRNVLPAGAPLSLYQTSSTLVDAYKRSECDASTGLAVFALTSRIIDRAEPGEMLRANVVWSHGLPRAVVTLTPDAPAAFRRGEHIEPEALVTGQRGNYFVTGTLALRPQGEAEWHIVADATRSQAQVAALRARLRSPQGLADDLEAAVREGGEDLRRLVAGADGLQVTGMQGTAVHHFANVLFNSMRGGVFAHDHDVPGADVAAFVAERDRRVAERAAAMLAALPETLPVGELLSRAAATGDADLERLAYEYLPIYFGRRHGDPSRPWNRFAIQVERADGSRMLAYEGNWRDIFQNWEALAFSFPAFLPSLVAKFVNASTADGFNPYRLTRAGIDWEVEEPEQPWSNIGYWGDHQVIYLLKFLEALERFSPGALDAMLPRRIHSYADVPYRIAPFAKIVENPRATIAFDRAHARRIEARTEAVGSDGRLLADADGRIVHVTLYEKLLVPVLAKLSNLVPGAGIWMNTQRPEWNDANNALVGNGVSVVTLCYLRRHLAFLRGVFERQNGARAEISAGVARWLGEVREALATSPEGADANDAARMALLSRLGEAFSHYREDLAAHGIGGPVAVPAGDLVALCDAALAHVDHAVRANARPDGLWHAYNLIEFAADGTELRVLRLQEMLEGQVAALSSGLVTPAAAVTLLDALFASRMYRPDQGSFMLYPERDLPGFLEKNVVPSGRIVPGGLLARLLAAGEGSIVVRDVDGAVRFHPDMRHAGDVSAALDGLAAQEAWTGAVAAERDDVLEVFEDVFHHHAFTGRSGTMYGFEGIGSIYWHMVAKLLLAVQETWQRAVREGAPGAEVEALAAHYQHVRAGLGFTKSPEVYGAFPSDPYSHTPAHAGAQQPGMTGQVKEEVLTRFGELGLEIEDGRVAFRPRLLERGEFLAETAPFTHFDAAGRPRTIHVPAGGLAFTYAGTPVVYVLTDGPGWIQVTAADGSETRHVGDELDETTSHALFARTGAVARIDVGVPARRIAPH